MSRTPDRSGWYPDPLKPASHERRWDGAEWTDETREASVPGGASASMAMPEMPVVGEVPSRRERRRQRRLASDPASDPGSDTDAGPEPEAGLGAELESGLGDRDEPEPEKAPPSARATVALVLAIVILVAVAVLQAAYLWGPLKDDPKVSSQRPVLLSQAAERSAADTAAKAAVAFTQRSYETYDKQVDTAAAMMTTDFETEFRQTTDDAKQRFVDAKANVTAEVAAQGVMTASARQVEVLIFLNQFTIKEGEESVFTPFRLKVTLIDTEQGWLVSDVDAA